MGLMESIRNFFSTPSSSEEGVKERWKAFDDGPFRDLSRGRDRVSDAVSHMLLWSTRNT